MKIILINGMHRSGTMLLSRLINALPDTFIIKDGMRIPWVYYRVETNEKVSYPLDFYKNIGIDFDLNRKVRDINMLKRILLEELKGYNFSFELDKRWKDEIMRFKQGFSYKEVYLHLYQTLSGLSGVQCVGAKHTHMYQYSSAVLSAFPNLKWIDTIRDSRGWYCSSRVSHKASVLNGIPLWNKAANAILSNIKSNQDRYMAITFEELILSRVNTLQKICNFLDIKLKITDEWFNNVQLTENDGSPWYPNPSFEKSGKEVPEDQNKRKSTDYQIMDPLPVYRWRAKLSLWEKIILKVLTGRNLKRINSMGSQKFNSAGITEETVKLL